ALVARAVYVLRAVVHGRRLVRRDFHRRHALESIDQRGAAISVERLRAHPVLPLLAAPDVHAAELSLARTVDDVRIGAVRNDRARFASRPGAPLLGLARAE